MADDVFSDPTRLKGYTVDELQKVLSLISSSPVEDSILQYYDTWGIAGKVMSVPYADRTGISDQTREMLGNVAYGCPVFSEMIPFSSKFQEKDTMYAWAKAAVTRNEDWGVFGGVRLSGLAAGKYPEEYQLGIRPMNKDDIIEVDNLSELIALDASYKNYVEEK